MESYSRPGTRYHAPTCRVSRRDLDPALQPPLHTPAARKSSQQRLPSRDEEASYPGRVPARLQKLLTPTKTFMQPVPTHATRVHQSA
jgi:hypothetical protein